MDDIQVTEQLSYEEVPVTILDRQVRQLQTKNVASVKVLWRNKNVEEVTWEAEEEIKVKYPHLFPAVQEVQSEASSPLGIIPFLVIVIGGVRPWYCML